MIIHISENCTREVYLDLTPRIKVLLSPSISHRGIGGSISVLPNYRNTPVEFYCTKCKKQFRVPELSFVCSNCGEVFPIQEGKVPISSGGTYCKTHIKRFESNDERVTDLVNILENTPITFERS